MRLASKRIVLIPLLTLSTLTQARQQASQNRPSNPSLEVTSRAVLVDVIVTDSSGKPIVGLARDAFTVKEQGKPQAISFFEEHGAAPSVQPIEMPKLPPDTFSNFSPFPEPPAVNVILLDSLNTRVGDQSYAHTQVMKFLNSAKPGTRSAIFTMGLALKFIQGFNDDPAILVAALNNKKNIEVEPSALLKSQGEADAQASLIAAMSGGRASQDSIGSMIGFLHENDSSRSIDRMRITLANLQRLAVFLQGFPGRKNIIWFSERVPTVFLIENDELYLGDPAIEDEIKKTIAMLAAARAALYPVDPHGVWAGGSPEAVHTSTETLKQITSDQISAQLLAEQSGGRAFANTNGLAEVLDKVTSDSGHFYTLSYSLDKRKMDGGFRKIDVKIAGGKYKLLYRSGYYAVDTDRIGSSLTAQYRQKSAAQDPEAVDPLLPFMELGMPQSQQILYKIRIAPFAEAENEPIGKNDKSRYKVDFAIDLKDLNLDLGTDGLHRGTLNFSLIVYDRYGNIINREDHVSALNIKPEAYAVFQSTGVPLHTELAVPKGNYWLRTGIYDQSSHNVGTLEIPLSLVKPPTASN